MSAHRIPLICATCNRSYEKRSDRVQSPDYCCLACRKIGAAKGREARITDCGHCGSPFMPRIYQLSVGQGKYCSLKCSAAATVTHRISPESRKRSASTYRANGHSKRPKGPDSPYWTGGQPAALRRRIESGKSTAYNIVYRAANPERAREWAKKRLGKMIPALPRGTVPKLLKAQRSRCIYCRASLAKAYHVDHIMPLKLGGAHEPKNLQLLCPTCNVRKSARHPVTFAQMSGMLL